MGLLEQMSRRFRLFQHHRRIDREHKQIVRECLKYYNSMHPGSQFELALGKIIRCKAVDSTPGHSRFWIHGNFLAHRKPTGCCSLLPGPRTLFFYEYNYHDGAVTCAPLDDEPVEEVSLLGFCLGEGKRRDGKFDCVCGTCGYRLALPYPFPVRTFECGHQGVKAHCRMCYLRAHVIHPSTGDFRCGHQKDAKFERFQEMLFAI